MIKIDIHDLPGGRQRADIVVHGAMRTVMGEFGYVLTCMHSRYKGANPMMAMAFQAMWRELVAEGAPVWDWTPEAGDTDMLVLQELGPGKEDKL